MREYDGDPESLMDILGERKPHEPSSMDLQRMGDFLISLYEKLDVRGSSLGRWDSVWGDDNYKPTREGLDANRVWVITTNSPTYGRWGASPREVIAIVRGTYRQAVSYVLQESRCYPFPEHMASGDFCGMGRIMVLLPPHIIDLGDP